jgi:hypothetical protein
VVLLTPDDNTPLFINGLAPHGTATGDDLFLSIPALGSDLTVTDFGSGVFGFAGVSPADITYTSIEELNVSGGVYDLTINLNAAEFDNDGIADDLLVVRSGANVVISRTGANDSTPAAALGEDPNRIGILYQDLLSAVNSLRIVGSNDDDSVTVNDGGGLIDFAGTVPGVTDNGNVLGTADFLFTGGLGTNVLNYVLNAAGTTQTYGIGDGGGMASLSGEILTSNTAPNTLSTFFTGVSQVNRTGAAVGGLTVLGDSSGNAITISDNGGGETRVAAAGYTPFDFSGNNYNALTVSGLGGDDILVLTSFGSGQTNDSPILLQGDGGADAIQVQSTSGETGPITLVGGTENDTFYLSDGVLPGSPQTAPGSAFNTGDVDNIAAVVSVFGENNPAGANALIAARNNRLFVTDEASAAGNVVGITNSAINDILGVVAGPDVGYSNIDTLAVTGSSVVDTLDAVFNAGSDLNTVTINGAGGADLLLLDLAGGEFINNAVSDIPNGALASVNLNGDDATNSHGVAMVSIRSASNRRARLRASNRRRRSTCCGRARPR